MKKLYLIANPVAGKAVINDKLSDIISGFTKAGYEVTVHITQDSSDASVKADYACKSGFDVLVCAGGDGTLSQCLQGVMGNEKRIPLGFIPAGSTNDFARSLGIPSDIVSAVRWITDGKPTSCDVGKLNDSYFTYISAFGAFTNVTYEASQQVKNILGHSAYIISGLMQITSLRSKRLRVEYDGNVLEDDFIFGMVTNSSSVAGLLSINDFLLDDGVFEVTLIKKPANIMQLQQIVRSLLNITEEINKEYIRFFRTKSITFTSLDGEPVPWTRDGEFGGEYVVSTITCCASAVQFITNDNKETNFAETNIELPDFLANIHKKSSQQQ